MYPNCVVKPDGNGGWILYVDQSCGEVIAFFPDKGDADAAQKFFVSEE